jgi:hypothetical protein
MKKNIKRYDLDYNPAFILCYVSQYRETNIQCHYCKYDGNNVGSR